VINNTTSWHRAQKERINRILTKVDEWPDTMMRLVAARLTLLLDAVDHLSGRPKSGSNHEVIARNIGELEDAVDLMGVKASV
jgi:hypothetical protein